MKQTLLAKSTSGEPYDVIFESVEGRLVIRCSCKAGMLYQQCKHKRSLIKGDVSMLFALEQADALAQILASKEAQPTIAALAIEEAALMSVESEKNRIAALEKTIKTRMGKLFSGAVV